MKDLTATLPFNLPHTILSEIRPPTCWAHPSLLTELRKQTPLSSSSSSDSCKESHVAIQNMSHIIKHDVENFLVSNFEIFFSILMFA